MSESPLSIEPAKLLDSLYPLLFGELDQMTYVVLDGASTPELLEQLEEQQPDYECLYRGELSEELAEVAPYLVRLLPDTAFTDWVLLNGWGRHWGIFALSTNEIRDVRKHFRSFLIVKDPEGKKLYFRYYDPRVLSVFLPTCTPSELQTMAGPLSAYWMESPDSATALCFSQNNQWKQQPVPLIKSFSPN